MPTSSASGPELRRGFTGGAFSGTSAISEQPGRAAERNKERLACFERPRIALGGGWGAGSMVEVAIVTLPQWVNDIRLLFAASRTISLYFRHRLGTSGQVVL